MFLKERIKKLKCKHVWRREKMNMDEMIKTRRTHKCICIKCGTEKEAGLRLPPGPLTEEQINEIIRKNYK